MSWYQHSQLSEGKNAQGAINLFSGVDVVPPVIPSAKPVSVEHIKIHGTHLESNLEGDAVDREVLVFLPPSYDKQKRL